MGLLSNTTSDKLIEYSKKGYLFHGSIKSDIDILEPRTAVDDDSKNTFNNDTAIFASDNACSTIMFAVISRSYLPQEIKPYSWSFNWETDSKGNVNIKAKINLSWKTYIEKKGHGYVYVLPSDTFLESSGSQWKSKIFVKPIDKMHVSLQDYIDMGGNIEWTEQTTWK